jgi:two-component system, NtrC family, nitrogen regulation response regulator GlnG
MPQSDSGTRQTVVPGWTERPERRSQERLRVPVLTVLCHPDPNRVGERAVLRGLAQGREARLSRSEPGFASPGEADPRPLADPWLSRTPIHLAAGAEPGGLRLLPGESRASLAADGVAVQGELALPAASLDRGVVLELAGRIALLLQILPAAEASAPRPASYGLVGESPGIARVRREISRVADLGVPVLLLGETGTGKELVAQALHRSGRRRSGPFLSVNLAAVPASLAASELFGAVRGAYTGAVAGHTGYFERAQGGTLFLDEIGDAPVEVQVSLLRVLETGEVQRVGGGVLPGIDVRLVAGTDADLEAAIAQGRFRPALFHRLAGYEIAVPPLRERRDDIGRLLFHFLRRELAEVGEERRLAPRGPAEPPWMPASLVARLARYDWPGNVRQLRNVARQLVIESRGAEVVQVGPQVERLLRDAAVRTGEIAAAAPTQASAPPAAPAGALPTAERERAVYRNPAEVTTEELLEALRAGAWEIKPAALRLGVSRTSLYQLIERCPGIRKAADLTRAEILACRERHGLDLTAMAAELEVSKSGLIQRMRKLGIAG